MPPTPLTLTNCRVKKVFTNDISDGYMSGTSGNETSAIASTSSGISSGRQFPSNLDKTITSPTLERPLRIKRRIKRVCPVITTKNELESESSQPSQTPPVDSGSPSISDRPSVMNLDGSVKLPHRKPALVIKRKIKKVHPQELTQNGISSESSNPSQSPCVESESILESLPTSRRRLKHRGFALARGQDLEEAMKNWAAMGAEPDIITDQVEEAYESDSVYSQESEFPGYAESLVDPWLNSKSR